jgi:tripartite-type tricarboxylate transporter receptor subunit TctC
MKAPTNRRAYGRRHVLGVATTLALASQAQTARAQAQFPTRPMRLVVSFAPGGSSDALARIVAAHLGRRLGQPVVVENRPGAGGTLGMAQVSRGDADGYTIVQGTAGTVALTPALMSPAPYDAMQAFAPIAFVASDSNGIFVHPSVPARTMDELAAWVRAQGRAVPFASSGVATPGHLGLELFARARTLNLEHVPYRGAAPALADVVAGTAPMIFTSMIVGRAMADAGRLRLLAVSARERVPEYPNTPTLREAGLAEMEVPIWFGYFAPPATPRPVLERYHGAFMEILRDPAFIAELRTQMMEPFPADQRLDTAPAFVASTIADVQRMIARTGVRLP